MKLYVYNVFDGAFDEKMIANMGCRIHIITNDGSRYDGTLNNIAPSEYLKIRAGESATIYQIEYDRLECVTIGVEETEPDMVNHPPHYQTAAGLEIIDVIEAVTADLKGIEAVCTGNVLKYSCRWHKKNGLQDLEKAKWYLEKLIDHVKNKKESN